MKPTVLFAIFTLGFALLGNAEEHCAETDTPRQCLQRLNLEQAANTAQWVAAAANTGASTTGSPARTALKDFLSVLSSNVGGAVLSQQKDESLALGYNLPMHFPAAQLRSEAVFRKPELSAAVQSAAGTALPSLKDGLSAAHDIVFGLSLNLTSQHLGRSIAPHHVLFDSMLTTLMAAQSDTGLAGVPLANFGQPFALLTPDAAVRATSIAAFEAAARASLPAVIQTLSTDFGTLLNNQPQLFASGDYHDRKETGGPHSYSAIVTWEIGSQNLNGFYANEGHGCEAANSCVEAFARYKNRTRKALMADRLALTVEYNRTITSRPALPDAISPLFITPAQRGYIYAITYGRPFASFLTGQEGRIDLSYSFDGKTTSKNIGMTSPALRSASFAVAPATLQSIPPPRDRFTATGTFTQKLSDRTSLDLSLVETSHEETLPGTCTTVVVSPFLGTICSPPVTTTARRFSVHTGITYKIPSVTRPSRGCCCAGGS